MKTLLWLSLVVVALVGCGKEEKQQAPEVKGQVPQVKEIPSPVTPIAPVASPVVPAPAPAPVTPVPAPISPPPAVTPPVTPVVPPAPKSCPAPEFSVEEVRAKEIFATDLDTQGDGHYRLTRVRMHQRAEMKSAGETRTLEATIEGRLPKTRELRDLEMRVRATCENFEQGPEGNLNMNVRLPLSVAEKGAEVLGDFEMIGALYGPKAGRQSEAFGATRSAYTRELKRWMKTMGEYGMETILTRASETSLTLYFMAKQNEHGKVIKVTGVAEYELVK